MNADGTDQHVVGSAGEPTGMWLVEFATITLANLGDPVEYLVPVLWIAAFGAAAGGVSYRLAGGLRG